MKPSGHTVTLTALVDDPQRADELLNALERFLQGWMKPEDNIGFSIEME